MKKTLSVLLAAVTLTGLVPVSAKTQTEYLVSLQDFEACEVGAIDDNGLKELGIIANTNDKAEMSIVEINGNKMLAYKPIKASASIEFPINYKLSTEENVVIEYDFESIATLANRQDSLYSKKWGTIGLSDLMIQSGGNGVQYECYLRGNASRGTYCLFDTRNAIGGTTPKDGYTGVGKLSVKTVYDYGEYDKNAASTNAMKTTLTNTSGKTVFTASGPILSTNLTNLTFNNESEVGLAYIDNVRVYTMPKMKLKSSNVADGAENVFIEDNSFNFEFTNEIADFSGVTVSADGTTISGYDVSADKNKLTVSFADPLDYATEYEFDFSSLKDDLGQFANSSVSFKTEKEPDIMLDSLDVTTANGLRTLGLELSNKSDDAKSVNVIMAIYNDKNVLKDTVTATVSVDANSTKEVQCGVADKSDYVGGTVRAYIWSVGGTPYFKSISKQID